MRSVSLPQIRTYATNVGTVDSLKYGGHKGAQAEIKRRRDELYNANRTGNEDYDRWLRANIDTNRDLSTAKQRSQDATSRINQEKLSQGEMMNASNIDRTLPAYIQAQAGDLRKQIAQDLSGARKNIAANANSRGMLFSGQRMRQEGDAQNMAQQQYSQGVGNIIRDAQDRAMQVAYNAAMPKLNMQEAATMQQNQMNSINQGLQQQRAQLMQGGLGMIGEGLGTAFANRTQTPSAPKTNANSNTMGSAYNLGRGSNV